MCDSGSNASGLEELLVHLSPADREAIVGAGAGRVKRSVTVPARSKPAELHMQLAEAATKPKAARTEPLVEIELCDAGEQVASVRRQRYHGAMAFMSLIASSGVNRVVQLPAYSAYCKKRPAASLVAVAAAGLVVTFFYHSFRALQSSTWKMPHEKQQQTT